MAQRSGDGSPMRQPPLYVQILVFVIVVSVAFLFGFFLIAEWSQPYSPVILAQHYRATVGLPVSAAAALMIVLLLTSAQGPIHFEGFGFKFRGGSGQVVMWVVCFLAIAVGIRLLW